MVPLALCLALPALAQTTSTGSGQAYPVRPLRMMVPAAAAGVTDIAARVLTPHLSEALGQSVVVDNRAGASGIIGTDTVALGYEIAGGSPQQFGEWLRSESVKWGKVIRDNNITAE